MLRSIRPKRYGQVLNERRPTANNARGLFQTTTDRNMTVAPLTVGSALPFAPHWRSSWGSSEPISSGTIVLNTDS
jgi:hypothetical protein